jgi:hypothetical protein
MKGVLTGMRASQLLKPIAHHAATLVHAVLLVLATVFIFATLSFFAIVIAFAQQTSTTSTTTNSNTGAVSPQPTPEAPSKSVIRGRVIYDDNNRPVRRARIMLLRFDGNSGPQRAGVTNERGEFRIKDIPAGSYFVMVDSPGVITPISSVELEEGMNEKAAMVSMQKEFAAISVNGTNTVDVQIRARRGGVITGRVTYQDGDPATNVQLIILRKKDNRLTKFITGLSPLSMLSLRTDDRGVYRIASLPPGEYVVGASEANTREDARDDYGMMGLTGGSNLSVSYYRNETSLKQATPIKVEAGQEATEINITLIERATYTISGTVVARQGRTPIRAQVSIQSKTESSAQPFIDAGPSTVSDEQGRWSFTGIPDGTYVIKADPGGYNDTEFDVEEGMKATDEDGEENAPATTTTATAPTRPPLVSQQRDVTVSGSDLSGVVIEIAEGGRLRGTITVEGNDKQLPPGINVLLTAREATATVGGRYGYVQPDGSFTVDKVPAGEFYLSVQELNDKFYVKSITAGGADLLREPVRVVSGSNVENIRIVISSDVATLQGRVVSSADAKPVHGALLLLVTADQSRWGAANSFTFGITEADGTFKITAAPGSYLLVLAGEGDNLRAINEAFIRARSAGAKAVTLTANGRETVELVAPSGGSQ